VLAGRASAGAPRTALRGHPAGPSHPSKAKTFPRRSSSR